MKLRKFFSEEDKSLKEQEKFINVDEWWKVFYMVCFQRTTYSTIVANIAILECIY